MARLTGPEFWAILPRNKFSGGDKMHSVAKIIIGSVALSAIAAVAYAQAPQDGKSMADASVTQAPGPVPNPANIPFTPPDKLVWSGDPKGEQQIKLFGDPDKPGLYGVLIKWNPGTGSRPHMHDQDRFIYVVSGTWWVSSSSVYDPKLSYPMPAGSVVKDVANTVHWDGVRAGGPPAILELVGMGPVKTIQVDENGKPKPRPPAQ
jgi:quercetin dioxygenase-like cupin family protein